MNTPRFNVFNQIHKGLRALLFDTTMKWQQTDMTNAEAAAPVVAQVNLLLELFDAHAYHEDTFIMHPAEQHDPQLMAQFEAEHETDLQLSKGLREKLATYQHSSEPYPAGYEVYYALNDFVAFNLKHMNKEEQLLNKVLWQNYTDSEIVEIETRLQQAIAPEKMGLYFEWMIKGMNDSELLTWLTIVKQEAPDFVLAALLGSCAQHLPELRWLNLERQLSDGIIVN